MGEDNGSSWRGTINKGGERVPVFRKLEDNGGSVNRLLVSRLRVVVPLTNDMTKKGAAET